MILDVIIPIYNKEKTIINFYNKIKDELKNIKYNLIFIDDFSTDKTLEILKEIQKKDENNIKILSLSYHQGKDISIYTGLYHTKHEYVCIYDSDLQASLTHITKMYDLLLNHPNYDQVCMYSNNNEKNNKIDFINKLFNLKIDDNKTYYRLLKRNMVKAILEYSKHSEFSIYTFEEIGFNTYYSKFDCKNKIEYINTKKLIDKSILLKYTSYIIFTLTLIYLILSIINIFEINNNILLVILLLFNGLQIYLQSNITRKKQSTYFLLKDKIGFDDELL